MYKKKPKIIIVGGTGFLGYHISKNLIKKNWKVISLSRRAPKPIRRLKKVKYLHIDISKKEKLYRVLNKLNNVEFVINLGGEVLHTKKKLVYLSHYKGTINLSNFFLNKKLRKFIQIGSSMEYGKLNSPHKEHSITKPLSDYGKAKELASKYVLNLYNKYLFPVVILRPYQVYGPFQETNRFIPYVIKSCLGKKNFNCSSGKQFRDFLYIEDFVSLINKCLKNHKINGEIINAGYGKCFKILDVVHQIRQIVGFGKPLFGKIILRKEENHKTYPDISKAIKLLKWKPKIKFKKGLNLTIKYFKSYKK